MLSKKRSSICRPKDSGWSHQGSCLPPLFNRLFVGIDNQGCAGLQRSVLLQQLCRSLCLRLRALHNQFIVNLQDQLGLRQLLFQSYSERSRASVMMFISCASVISPCEGSRKSLLMRI